MLADEAALVVQRLDGLEITRAVMLKAAVAALFGEAGAKHFQELVERLSED